jgi:hypothetical protein
VPRRNASTGRSAESEPSALRGRGRCTSPGTPLVADGQDGRTATAIERSNYGQNHDPDKRASDAVRPLDRAPNRLEHKGIRAHRTRYRSVHIRARRQTLTAADPLPEDLREVITAIHFAGPCAPIWPESGVTRAWRHPPRSAKPAPRVKRQVGEQVPDGSRACDTRVQVSARLAWVSDQLDRFAHPWDPQL